MARKHTDSELLSLIDLYLSGISYQSLVSQYSLKLSDRSFKRYVNKYRTHGSEGIKYQRTNRSYTKELKFMIVNEHIQTGYGPAYLANKYNIPSETTVNNWINRYTEGKENKDYSPNSGVYNIVSAKKSYEEKVKIVEDYINNKLTYKEAAEKYQVNYNNIYSWVNKYKKHGPKDLEDNRGRGKPSELQTKEERLNAEVEALKARNKWLEMENDVLKKRRKIAGSLKSQELDKKRNT
ncbi:MAG: helix-turn-helix domain-containing protein [Tetragenococcus koreensis]|nr:helix-turn-helix domain-containing protein [Tetragenococcus koreensis]